MCKTGDEKEENGGKGTEIRMKSNNERKNELN